MSHDKDAILTAITDLFEDASDSRAEGLELLHTQGVLAQTSWIDAEDTRLRALIGAAAITHQFTGTIETNLTTWIMEILHG